MNWLSLVLTYLPVVLKGVVAVEQSIGSEAPGAAKKTIVVDAIIAGAKSAETATDPNVAGISTLVDTVVSSLNATGVFSHSPKP